MGGTVSSSIPPPQWHIEPLPCYSTPPMKEDAYPYFSRCGVGMRLCTMSVTQSSANSTIFASLMAAWLFLLCHHCVVCNANSSFPGDMRQSLAATACPLLAICPANSSLMDHPSATLVAALFLLHHCAMCYANSSTLDELRAPLATASFLLRAMCNANSSTLDEHNATLVPASFTHITVCLANSSLTDHLT